MTRENRVKIIEKHNRLAVRFTYPPKKRNEIYLGLSATSRNKRLAEGIAANIERDIAYDCYDFSLRKYKGNGFVEQTSQNNNKEESDFIDIRHIWKQYAEYRKPLVAESTYRVDYHKIDKRLSKIPERKLNSASEIRDWLLSEYSRETCRRTIVQLSACCEWASKRGDIKVNPFKNITNEIQPVKNSKNRSNQPFSEQEVAAIIKAFKDNTYCSPKSRIKHSYYLDYVVWMFYTGMRPEEAVALQYRDIKRDYININKAFRADCKVLKDTKNHKPRKISFSEPILEIIKRRKEIQHKPEDLFFTSPNGKLINYHNFSQRAWKKVVEELVKSGEVREYLPPYHTKHTFITLCLEKGYSPKQIEGLVGVSAGVILSNYAGVMQQMSPPVYKFL